jgi:alpha,alpha-trehalose phosphorylase
MDLRDLEHNTRDGVHIAALAGTWIALVCGFAGLRQRGSGISFAPRLPQGLARMAFSVLFRGQLLRVEVTQHTATYRLADGEPIQLVHHGGELTVEPGKPQDRPIPPLPARPLPTQPPGREPEHRQASGASS